MDKDHQDKIWSCLWQYCLSSLYYFIFNSIQYSICLKCNICFLFHGQGHSYIEAEEVVTLSVIPQRICFINFFFFNSKKNKEAGLLSEFGVCLSVTKLSLLTGWIG